MIHVTVTQNDIDRGFKDSCLNCPVALAMTRAFGETVSVDKTGWCTMEGRQGKLPQVARDFIEKFDTVLDDAFILTPFEFDVEK